MGMDVHQRQTWMRKQVRTIESACKVERKDSGKTVLGKAGLYEVDPRDRPKNPKKSGKRPLCHASDPELAKEHKKQWRSSWTYTFKPLPIIETAITIGNSHQGATNHR